MTVFAILNRFSTYGNAAGAAFLTAVLSPLIANAELYGIGRGISTDTFYQINTTTGAATAIFSYSNIGTTGTFGLTYNPISNRYLTVQQSGNANSALIELDAVGATAAAVAHGIPSTAFEGIEYSAVEGGVVVSYGNTTNATTGLALLNPSNGLILSNPSTGLPDTDVLFVDSTGSLNVVDTNNPYLGWQRNTITNPFGAISINVNGLQNSFTSTDTDLAWKADETTLFLTRTSSLYRVVGPNNLLSVGPYGGGINITGIAVGPPIPEPVSMCALFAGLCACTRRRRS